MLWRGDPMAIWQVMTVQEGDELECMGYAEFRSRCADAGILSGTSYDDARGGYTKTRQVDQQHTDGVTKVDANEGAARRSITAVDEGLSMTSALNPTGKSVLAEHAAPDGSLPNPSSPNPRKTLLSTEESSQASKHDFR